MILNEHLIIFLLINSWLVQIELSGERDVVCIWGLHKVGTILFLYQLAASPSQPIRKKVRIHPVTFLYDVITESEPERNTVLYSRSWNEITMFMVVEATQKGLSLLSLFRKIFLPLFVKIKGIYSNVSFVYVWCCGLLLLFWFFLQCLQRKIYLITSLMKLH